MPPANDGRFTRLHAFVVGVSVLALGFDLGEVALSGGLAAVFSNGPGAASPAALSWLLASVPIGGALGAWPAGRLADRFGRRNAVVFLLILLGVASVGASFSPDLRILSLMRGASGIALGVLPVILVAYLTDTLPVARRGRVIMAASAVGFAGAPLLLMLMSAIGEARPWGLEGWRLTVAFGGAGSLVCACLFLALPEAPRWLDAAGRREEARRVRRRFATSPSLAGAADRRDSCLVDRTPRSGPAGSRLALVIFLCILSPVVSMGFPVLSGAVLIARGFALGDSLLYIALGAWGGVGGALLASVVLDRVERPTALALCGAGMLVGLIAFFSGRTPMVLVFGAGLFQASVAVYIVALNIYAAELFDVERRAAFTALGWGLQRATAVAAMFILVPVLLGAGPGAVLAVMATCLVLAAATVLLFGPRSQHSFHRLRPELER